MTIQTTELKHLTQIVECHKEAFPDSLSTKLGSTFIAKMMEWYIVSERGVLFHILDEKGKMAGYCGGIVTTEPGMLGAVSSISQYAFNSFVWAYFRRPWLLLHKENIKKWRSIVKNIAIKTSLRKSSESPQKDINEGFLPFLGLVVIGVKQVNRGSGFGSCLLKEFEKRAKARKDIQKIQLSVKAENKQALNAYLRNGWEIRREDPKTKQLSKNL